MRNVIIRSLVHGVFICVFGVAFIWIAWPPEPAGATITVTEFPICTAAGYEYYQYGPAISGNMVVWEDSRNGYWDIYGYDLSTHSEFAICTAPSNQLLPAISGDTVVWIDYRNGYTNPDIYGYDLSTHSEFPISTAVGEQWYLAISGDTVVWWDDRNGNWDIYGYDLSTHAEFAVCTAAGEQWSPAISGDTVVWHDLRNGGYDVYGYDLSTHSEFAVCTDAGDQWTLAISGDTVIWGDTRNGNYDIYGYDLSTHSEFPITTTVRFPSDNLVTAPAISGDKVVWEDYRNGNYDIYGYDLSTHSEFPICTAVGDQYGPAISGDTVVWTDCRNGNYDIYGATIDYGTTPPPPPPPPQFNLTSPPRITFAIGEANGIFSDVYGSNWNLQDPLRTQSPAPATWKYDEPFTFGNTIETTAGYSEVVGIVSTFQDQKEHGQWSRLGQQIDPSIGLLVTQLDPCASNTWRTRDLSVSSTASFEFTSQVPGKTQDTFTIDLTYTWRAVGMAKEDTVGKVVSAGISLAGLNVSALKDTLGVFMAKGLVAFTNSLHSQFNLYGVGVQMFPDKSRFTGWTEAVLWFEKSDGTVLGSLDPLLGGFYGQDPFGGVQINWGDTPVHASKTLSLPVGEPVKVNLITTTHAAALGAAESYFGITGYTITISSPEGGVPLVISGTDPADSPSMTGLLSSSLVQAAHTAPFIVGNVETQDTYADIQPLAGYQVVVLNAKTDSPLAGLLIPFELVSGTTSISAHVDALWSDPNALQGVSMQFGLLLLDDIGDGEVTGGLVSDYFSQPLLVDGDSLWSWHCGERELVLDVSDIALGDYALFIIYGNSDGVQSDSALVVSGLSANMVPEAGTVAMMAPALVGLAGVVWRTRRR